MPREGWETHSGDYIFGAQRRIQAVVSLASLSEKEIIQFKSNMRLEPRGAIVATDLKPRRSRMRRIYLLFSLLIIVNGALFAMATRAAAESGQRTCSIYHDHESEEFIHYCRCFHVIVQECTTWDQCPSWCTDEGGPPG